MPDFKEVKSTFPTTVWDGSSVTRSTADVSSKDVGDAYDRVQQVAEIVKMQQVIQYLAAMVDVELLAPVLTPFGVWSDPGLTVTVTVDASLWTGGVINWGDGETTTIEGGESSFEHEYGDAGTYTVEVTATNLIGTSNQTFTIEVTEPEA